MTPDPRLPVDLDALTDAYRLGEIHAIRYLPDGRMNRNWKVAADRGRFALKHLTDRDPGTVRRNLELLRHLAAKGIPLAAPIATAGGDLVCETGGNHYYLCEWIEGEHVGAEMSLAQAEHMGTVIARVHRALADPGLGLPALQPGSAPVNDPDAALAETGRFLKAAERPDQDGFDRAAAPVLRRRLDLIAASAPLRPEPGVVPGPHGWTHGDCQDWNLIWSGDRVRAVIDWDRIRFGAYAEELVRAATWQFNEPDGRIDLAKVAAFLAGYRSVQPIDGAALAEAARRRWWKMLSHCWHLDFHYDRGDGSCDDLFFSDDLLMSWWTANLDAVEAAFGA
ncbi:phosphotransferase [Glycomyces sp. NPDC049804]|uniref:phosphotransferase n=1 Tax=Glycomyces sp. NPDC049804 TaxID=3154363 RepID=UPI003440E495